LTQPEPLSVLSIQKQLLDENTVLLEYALGNQRSFLWLVTPVSVRSFLLPGQKEIETAARQAYRDLGVNTPAGGPAVRALSRILLGRWPDSLPASVFLWLRTERCSTFLSPR
jgi:hypothetical protein